MHIHTHVKCVIAVHYFSVTPHAAHAAYTMYGCTIFCAAVFRFMLAGSLRSIRSGSSTWQQMSSALRLPVYRRSCIVAKLQTSFRQSPARLSVGCQANTTLPHRLCCNRSRPSLTCTRYEQNYCRVKERALLRILLSTAHMQSTREDMCTWLNCGETGSSLPLHVSAQPLVPCLLCWRTCSAVQGVAHMLQYVQSACMSWYCT